uniref:Uncharacterized protein n=1 Tax=Crocodylus porosus TaxID=8502 RepID=A0A7M4DXH1_CROPO
MFRKPVPKTARPRRRGLSRSCEEPARCKGQAGPCSTGPGCYSRALGLGACEAGCGWPASPSLPARGPREPCLQGLQCTLVLGGPVTETWRRTRQAAPAA